MKKTLMIDLDGVLNEYRRYEENYIPEIKGGAKEFLEELSSKYELVLYTTRNAELARRWLREGKIDGYFKEITNIKKPAYIYIDDRAIKFNGNYAETLTEIENFEVYWKNQPECRAFGLKGD